MPSTIDLLEQNLADKNPILDLSDVWLDHYYDIQSAECRQILSQCKHINTLIINPNIEYLDEAYYSPTKFPEYLNLPVFNGLTTLQLDNCEELTPDGKKILSGLPNLQTLQWIEGCML
jgi:hypothetical protein